MSFRAVIVVLMTIAGLGALIWVANWPFNTPWEKDLGAEERRINVAHNRRHHRAAARMLSPTLALIFGIASASLFTGEERDQFAAVVMGACSAVCLGVFAALIKRGRRRPPARR
ncbi:hypothetical protein ACFY03_15945 [Micromonospora chersina]|uniref:hypothetical protein n=1 Tax=Micromonospora chersina TaxID=47854 RepID=UPI0036ACC46E